MNSHTNGDERKVVVSFIIERLLAYWYAISQDPHFDVNLIKSFAKRENKATLPLEKLKATPSKLKDNQPEVQD